MIRKLVLLGILLSTSLMASFNDGFHLSTMMGCSFSGPSPLLFEFNDRDDVGISARYKNLCFDDSHWWSARLENWTDKTAWGLELIHHKIYLKNTNDVVQSFSISDGYNLLFFNLVKQQNRTNFRVGMGVVLAHVDVTISGRERFIRKGFNGHYLTGPAFQIGVEHILWESAYHFVSLDTKFTAAYAKAPISSSGNEFVTAPDYAIHLSLALGSKPAALSAKSNVLKASYFVPLVYPSFVGSVLGTGLLPSGY